MKGLEISKAFFEKYGLPMLKEQFPEVLPYLAAGLIGPGSECLGYDDETSQDHDFEPGFCIFLPSEEVVDRRTAFLLERAYYKLPREFMGFKRSLMAPVGGARNGVIRTSEFFTEKTGSPDGNLTPYEWLRLPEQSLLECVNGEIFMDNYGEVSAIRERLSKYPPDIFRKKLAGHLLLMSQSGQYNYNRTLGHGETAAAQLAVNEFVRSTISAIFLLNGKYQPYYKWSFRALRELPELSIEAELLEYLLITDNTDTYSEEKYMVIEGICSDIIDCLIDRKLTEAICGDLEKHAYSVNDGITDPEIRNMHILAAV
ncbi:MAG: DUF4037 domain-containing protein [Firmicutes bacterium]|nr:DUF4037 domain-containing protein [Bacillota bacterium]